MATTVQIGEGKSPAPDTTYLWSAAEDGAYALFDAFRDNGRAMWLEPGPLSGPITQAIGAGPADPPAGFEWGDRVADRLFRPEPVRNRHPFLVVDSITGKPCMMFGAGGAAPNALDDTFNGTLVSPAIKDATGAEANARPLILPAQGWTCLARVRVPAPGATMNGVTYNAVGGAVLGAAAVAGAADCLAIQIERSIGRLRMFNRIGVTTNGQWYERGGDLRDGAWHTIIGWWDPATGSMGAEVDGVASAILSGVTTDIAPAATSAGADLPMIGGVGGSSGGPDARFSGAVSVLAFLPNATGKDAAVRAKLRAAAAEK